MFHLVFKSEKKDPANKAWILPAGPVQPQFLPKTQLWILQSETLHAIFKPSFVATVEVARKFIRRLWIVHSSK